MFFKSSSIQVLLVASCLLSSSTFAGNIKGKVDFKGTKPNPATIKMTADPNCIKIHAGKKVTSDQVVVNGNNTLRNVFVYVKKGLEGKKFPVPTQKATINQNGCTYTPHVFGMMAKQPLEIINSDATMHNIHALPKNSKPFNIAQLKGKKMVKTFEKPEIMVKIKCDVHNWMAAYVGVLDHPFYAVTDDQGNFEIKNLPAGEYEIEAWHEKYGVQTMNVSVGAADTKTVDFSSDKFVASK